MSHLPKRSSVMGNRKTGDLADRKIAGNQSQAAGGRYDINEMTKNDRNTAFSKVQMLKLQGQAKFPLKDGDYVELDPVKQNMMASPQG